MSLEELHTKCIYHRDDIEGAGKCSCFNCFALFPPVEIKRWADDGRTAICPRCDIDSVLPGIYSEEILQQMYNKYFT